ncbi:DNA repair protein RadC (fragment) [Vibrio crassostreae]
MIVKWRAGCGETRTSGSERGVSKTASCEAGMAYLPLLYATPSQADRRITRQLTDALALVDIRVLDHFVVSFECVVSFSERGWI